MRWALALIIAIILDYLLGDPKRKWHPVALMGQLISWLEKLFFKKQSSALDKKARGMILVLSATGLTVLVTWLGFYISAKIRYGAFAFTVICFWSAISPRTLAKSGREVANLLNLPDLSRARLKLSMLVGRDTQQLNKTDIALATIETIAENLVDGLAAPVIYSLIGGPLLAVFYRCVNTLDSMVGYRNERYQDFGWAAAKLDDVLNYIPARLSRYLLSIAAFCGHKNWLRALIISFADAYKHASPNSGIPEATMAGALNIRLGGPRYYQGKKNFYGYLGKGAPPDVIHVYEAAAMLEITTLIIVISLAISLYLI